MGVKVRSASELTLAVDGLLLLAVRRAGGRIRAHELAGAMCVKQPLIVESANRLVGRGVLRAADGELSLREEES